MSGADLPLAGLRVLLVEDHYVIAAELAKALRDLGATVLGPAGTLAHANALGAQHHDVALLNIDLHGESIFALADELTARGVPIAFITGYSSEVLPRHLRGVPRLDKPVGTACLAETVLSLAAREVLVLV